MSTLAQTANEASSRLKDKQAGPAFDLQPGPSVKKEDAAHHMAWVAKAPRQPLVLESVDLGPLGSEDVEIAVEYCGLCHSDLSVWGNDWGISQYPAILGHEAVGRVTAVGPNAKGSAFGQRVGVGWFARSDMLSPVHVGKPSPLPAGAGDAASELLRDVFGDPTVSSRLVFGVAILPFDSPVELESQVEVKL
jgi:hypothetical protein